MGARTTQSVPEVGEPESCLELYWHALQFLSWLIPTIIFAFLDRCWSFHGAGCHGPGPSSWVGTVSSDPSILDARLRLLFLTCITSHSPILNFIFTQGSRDATANFPIQPSSFIGLNNLKLALLSTPSLSQVISESAERTPLPPPTSAKRQEPLHQKSLLLTPTPSFHLLINYLSWKGPSLSSRDA